MPLTWHCIDLTRVQDPRLWALADAADARWRQARREAARTVREGLGGGETPTWLRTAAATGHLLFRAVCTAGRDVFADGATSQIEPLPNGPEPTAHLTGYHLRVPTALLGLPWAWLHNGVDFLLRRVVLSVGPAPLGESPGPAAWQERRRALQFLQRAGDDPVAALGAQDPFRSPPEILALAHDPATPRAERELAAVADALHAAPVGRRLARLRLAPPGLPASTVARRVGAHHGLHYCGPVVSDPVPALLLVPDPDDRTPEPVGVDPITALLDDTAQRVAEGRWTPTHANSYPSEQVTDGWELPDGRLLPESLPPGPRPPLVVSNGHCHLPRLGPRWLAAGCQVVVGPVVPVSERTAERFAAGFYHHLGRGSCVAAAWRATVLDLLAAGDLTGLSYGTLGDGCFSLLYL